MFLAQEIAPSKSNPSKHFLNFLIRPALAITYISSILDVVKVNLLTLKVNMIK